MNSDGTVIGSRGWSRAVQRPRGFCWSEPCRSLSIEAGPWASGWPASDGCRGIPAAGRIPCKFPIGIYLAAVAVIAGRGAWTPLYTATLPSEPETGIWRRPRRPRPALVPPRPTGAALYPETAPEEAAADGLKISSQHWRRGGLGSNALVTFTLRNANDYAVKDIEISCAFSRRDGSHLTDRTRVVHDTVKMKGKRFAHWHIGFVNVNASKAKCSPVAARHI